MSTSYQALINNAEGKYSIQFETENYDYFKMVEKACQKAIDKSDIFNINCYLRDCSSRSEIEKTIEFLKTARFRIKPEYIKEYSEAFEIALVALLKLIPKKPSVKYSDNIYNGISIVCSHCRKEICNSSSKPEYIPHYCPRCGQALDLEDNNGKS